MELNELEILLQKFYKGETTVEEESMLKDYFSIHKVPEHLAADKAYFDTLTRSGSEDIAEDELAAMFTGLESDNSQESVHISKQRFLTRYVAIAASVILIISSSFFLYHYFGKGQNALQAKISDTYKDPQIAYLETKRVLMLVSKNLNRGSQNLASIKKFDQGINELKKISAFNEATGIISSKKVKN